MKATLNDLRAATSNLAGRDKDFALDLVDAWERRGFLSEKQAHWAGIMVERAARVVAPALPTVDLSKLHELFARAKAGGLKRPKIRLELNGADVRLKPAPDTSQNAGFIYVMSDGEYLGKVSPKGQYHGNDQARPLLEAFAQDPAGTALAYGKATGNCCFCAHDLTDPASVAVGYGPICAERYGLPHGDKRIDTRLELELKNTESAKPESICHTL